MPFILVAVLVVVAIMVFFTVAGSLVSFALFLLMAGIVGWLADLVVPGRLPYGWLGAITAGLVGAWLGTLLMSAVGMGAVGPELFGIRFIPALIGAIILAVVAELAGKALTRRSTI